MKNEHFSWKFLFLLICDIGLYLKKCSGNLQQILREWVTYVNVIWEKQLHGAKLKFWVNSIMWKFELFVF